jgi:hypothetical protein
MLIDVCARPVAGVYTNVTAALEAEGKGTKNGTLSNDANELTAQSNMFLVFTAALCCSMGFW